MFSTSAARDSVKIEGDRQQRAAADQARGAARVLITELTVASQEIRELGDAGEFSQFTSEYGIAVPYEDVRLIAGKVDTGDWRVVSHALNRIRSLDRYVSRTGDGDAIPDNTMQVIRADLRAIDAAINAIEPVAGTGEALADNGRPVADATP
jgi:hypothetical protein